MKKLTIIFTALLLSPLLFSQTEQAIPLDQAKIVFNGAYIIITNNANLVVQNTAPSALSVKAGGGIISEGAGNNVIWNITNDTSYSVPFVATDLTAIPVSFNTLNGTGAGLFSLSTYSGAPDWQNSNYLPPSVNNVNRNGKDNSKHLVDRFWKIAPSGYTRNPQLTNLKLSYRDLEWNETGNIIMEKNLAAQNWDGTEWKVPKPGNDNVSANYVKISFVGNVFPWWCLVDSDFPLSNQAADFVMKDGNTNLAMLNQQTVNNAIALSQNFPNPFANATTINYSLPVKYLSAKIIITDKNGNALKTITLFNNKGSANVDASTFASGAYQYSLYVDGRFVSSKQMEILK